MTLLIIGATDSAVRQIETMLPAGVHVVTGGSADWILVATTRQRADAIAAHRLAPYRIVEVPELASDLKDHAARDAVRAGLVAMAGIGPARQVASPAGVAIARMVVRRLTGRETAQVPAPVEASLPSDAVPIGVGVAGVAGRIPAGPRLDETLATLARERVKRFASHAVRLD